MSRDDVLRQLKSVDWSKMRSNARVSSEYVPSAFQHLIDARTEDEAKAAYWLLDNRVVTQGRLFQSTEQLVPILLAALKLPLSPPARHRVLELVTEIALGVTAEEEARLGNSGLADAARAAIRRDLATIYGLLSDEDPRIRRAALHVVDAVEIDRRRFHAAATRLQNDPDEEVRKYVLAHVPH